METIFEVTGKIMLEEDETFAVDISVEFDTDDVMYAEVRYNHITTGSPCESISQVFAGWSEQDKEANQKWNELERRINLNDDLLEFMASNEPNYLEFTINEFGFLKIV
jgi:hypothetical protein